jgi:integrase/recombinase XerD
MTRPPWVESYLNFCARSGPTPRTMRLYTYLVNSITNHYGLDLQTCTEQQLMAGLDKIRTAIKPSTYSLYSGITRRALNFLDREDLAKKIPQLKQPDRETRVKEQLLMSADIDRLIRGAGTRTERLLITLLYETGARCGEIANLRIRDLQFDEFSAILALTGKSGTRKRRVYAAVPDLRQHVNDHPLKDNPEAPLFLTHIGTRYGYPAIYDMMRKLGQRILKKPIHPHQLRHSKATLDSRHFTDREMMQLYGWKTPLMVGTYSHLSMRDVDEKDLTLHGLKPREETLRPIVNVQPCPVCKEENAPYSVYCGKCGCVLGSGTNGSIMTALQDGKFIAALVKNKQFIDALRKAVISA